MARRRHKRNPRSKYKVKHVVLKRNGRRLRRNGPKSPAAKAADAALGAIATAEAAAPPPGPKAGEAGFIDRPGRGFKAKWAKGVRAMEAKQRVRASKALRSAAKAERKKAKKSSMAVVKRSHAAQAARMEAMAALISARGRTKAMTSPLVKAMSVKSNPGFAGAVESAKVLLPQVVGGSLSLAILARAGKYAAELIVQEDKAGVKSVREAFMKDGKMTALGTYMPAISTAGLSLVGYMLADKFVPKYKGAVLIGGMIGAVVQAVMASVDAAKPDSFASQIKAALLPAPVLPSAPAAAGFGEYTTVGAGIFHGLGEYTTVGSGIFHGLGEYTTIGTGADNATEFAADSLRGLDDASQFAPGEGGILSGGIFK